MTSIVAGLLLLAAKVMVLWMLARLPSKACPDC
jgi:hypothetical protein